MLRRSFITTGTASLASGCVQMPKADPNAPPLGVPADAPPPSKIQRLLVWLPAPSATDVPGSGIGLYAKSKRLFDNDVFISELRQKLQPYGVEIGVGTSSGLELDRRDEQRVLAARLKPTHRLEIDLMQARATRSSGVGGGSSAIAIMKWSLFDARTGKLVRFRVFGANGDASALRAHVDYMVEHLAAQGFL